MSTWALGRWVEACERCERPFRAVTTVMHTRKRGDILVCGSCAQAHAFAAWKRELDRELLRSAHESR